MSDSLPPLLQHSLTTTLLPFLGLCVGYLLVIFFNPIRPALRDGFRCIMRFKRIWLAFVMLGFAYSVFRFATFTPLQQVSDLDPTQFASIRDWNWPRLVEVWRETPLPALEGVAGIFDNATTTYPLSIIAAFLLLCNWRGVHGALWKALQQRFRSWGYLVYLIVVLSAIASVFKAVVFWRLPVWRAVMPDVALFQTAATVDAVSFIFEYLFGVYIQVYLITVALAWIKGLSFTEEGLFQFAVRRFTYVLKWAGIVVLVSMLLVRLPLLIGYFTPFAALDYQNAARYTMSALILLFCSVQISLVLHNEDLGAAVRAHGQLLRRNGGRVGWFFLICALHFYLLAACDTIVRAAAADRMGALILWKIIFVGTRGLVTGWLLASWVCLFRQCETGRIDKESWIRY